MTDFMKRAEHMAWLMRTCPNDLQGKLFDSIKHLEIDQYFALSAWAFNQTTRSNPAHSREWYDMIIDESYNYELGI